MFAEYRNRFARYLHRVLCRCGGHVWMFDPCWGSVRCAICRTKSPDSR